MHSNVVLGDAPNKDICGSIDQCDSTTIQNIQVCKAEIWLDFCYQGSFNGQYCSYILCFVELIGEQEMLVNLK